MSSIQQTPDYYLESRDVTPSKVLDLFGRYGFLIVENLLNKDFISKCKQELLHAIALEKDYHKGKPYIDENMVLLCALYGGSFIEIFNNERLLDPFNAVLGKGCIVYAYTSSSMPPSGKNYSTRIHVDSPRIIPGCVTNVGATILLDDFTEDNGATWYLPSSYERADAPDEQEFFSKAKRLIAPAGSIWFFNARTWHAGGVNNTNNWRHALTINMCRPWMKQRIDIPRALSNMQTDGFSQTALQKLGFFAQTPANYDEYYVAPEKRKFKQPVE